MKRMNNLKKKTYINYYEAKKTQDAVTRLWRRHML